MSWDGFNTSIAANRFQKAFVVDYLDLSGRLIVRNHDASFNRRLFVMGDVSFVGNLFVDKDVSLNGNLILNGSFRTLRDISVNTISIGRGGGGVATNTAVGFDALFKNATGNNSTAVGYQAAEFATGGSNTAIGSNAMLGANGSTSGQYSVAVGHSALETITTGGHNTAIGYQALQSTTGGATNVAVGSLSLRINTGSNNTALGYQAGTAGTANTTGGNNTFIGCNTQANLGSYNYSTALGAGATITGSNQVVLGTASEKVVMPGDASLNANLYVSGKLGIGMSDPTVPLEVSGNVIIGNMFCNSTVYPSAFIIGHENYAGTMTTDYAFYHSAIGDTIINSYRSTVQFRQQNLEMMRIHTTGNVGIRTNTPVAPLHVGVNGTIATSNARYFTPAASQLTVSAAAGSPAAGIYTTGSVISTVGFYASSDSRIKKNIMDATDLSCSYILQHLKPKIFNFIDIKERGIEPVWGFIAQEVKQIMPNAITYMKDFITNIFETADLCGNMITLRNKTTAEILKDEVGYNKLKIFNTDEKDTIVSIKEIIDEKRFIIESEEPIETENNLVFVYGQEVPDFHSLDKDMIFTLTTAVVKELDNESRIIKERVKILEDENATLKQELKDIIKRLENAGI